jgi:hypothetical protein
MAIIFNIISILDFYLEHDVSETGRYRHQEYGRDVSARLGQLESVQY